ncbi:hypothetical protein EDD22DRAFT_347767 [Suillus occidentalis]|nr:hypothetical protein EDD22DRAFT_347767 [Suillus occidentalis]
MTFFISTLSIPTRLQRGMEASDNVFLDKCFASAKMIIEQMIEVLTPSGLMRAAPDGHFVFASFASAFMLKLLRPEFAQLLTRQMKDEIFELIGRLITTLQDVAIIFTANWCYLHLVHHTTSHRYSQNYSTLPRPCTSFDSISQDQYPWPRNKHPAGISSRHCRTPTATPRRTAATSAFNHFYPPQRVLF